MNLDSTESIRLFRESLLAFYDECARDLPWRRTRDPYAVWISEVMAQQTRIETVVPYYERWISRFPDVHALADADRDAVLESWEGLGYYSRARNLHAAARLVRERHGGQLPGTYDALRDLPGIGEYTAGAIASIAFGEAAPAVDGNVRRVVARLLDDPAPTPVLLRSVAAALVPDARPGDFNQALMELGATICMPRAPRCVRCPVATHCAAFAAGTQLHRPLAKPKTRVPLYRMATAVLRSADGRVLIARRPPGGLLAGMWSFPSHECVDDESAAGAVIAIAAAFGTPLSMPRPIATIDHTFSHRRERYECHVVDIEPAAAPDHECVWIGQDRRGFALPRAQQRIHAAAFNDGLQAATEPNSIPA